MKIWFRVGMEADVTQEELNILANASKKQAEQLFMNIIKRAELSGETYIPSKDNGHEEYDNPNNEINFLF